MEKFINCKNCEHFKELVNFNEAERALYVSALRFLYDRLDLVLKYIEYELDRCKNS